MSLLRARHSPDRSYQLTPKPLSSTAIFKRDLQNSAWHEAGHIIVARHFKLESDGYLYRSGAKGKEAIYMNTVFGRVRYTKTTKFRQAVIGWAGTLATALNEEGEDFDLWEFFDMCSPEELSATDYSAIDGWSDRWQSYTKAHSILTGSYASVEREAKNLIAEFKRSEKKIRKKGNSKYRWSPNKPVTNHPHRRALGSLI